MHQYESTGKWVDSSEPEEFKWLLLGKASRDWHITQWGEGLAGGVLHWQELLDDGVPETVVDSARKAGFRCLARTMKRDAPLDQS